MARFVTFTPDGDSAVGSWLTDSGGAANLYQKIDEGLSSPVDTNDFIKAPNDVTNTDYKCTLSATPAEFSRAKDGAGYNIRYRVQARTNDTYGLSIRVVSGATILMAADAAGTFTVVNSNITSTSFTNSGTTTFAYLNTSANKAFWDAAVLEIRQTYTQSAGKDGGHIEVSAFDLSVNYSLALPGDAGAFTLTGNSAALGARRQLAGGAGTYSLSGNAAFLIARRKIAGGAGAYALAGSAAAFGFRMAGATGAYAISGSAALVVTRRVAGVTGAFTVTGNDAAFFVRMAADSGAFVLTGGDAGFQFPDAGIAHLPAGTGLFAVSGSAGLTARRLIVGDAGALALTGGAVQFRGFKTLLGGGAAFTLTGGRAVSRRRFVPTLRKIPARGRARLSGRKVSW